MLVAVDASTTILQGAEDCVTALGTVETTYTMVVESGQLELTAVWEEILIPPNIGCATVETMLTCVVPVTAIGAVLISQGLVLWLTKNGMLLMIWVLVTPVPAAFTTNELVTPVGKVLTCPNTCVVPRG